MSKTPADDRPPNRRPTSAVELPAAPAHHTTIVYCAKSGGKTQIVRNGRCSGCGAAVKVAE